MRVLIFRDVSNIWCATTIAVLAENFVHLTGTFKPFPFQLLLGRVPSWLPYYALLTAFCIGGAYYNLLFIQEIVTLTLIYMGGGKFPPRQFFYYNSKTVDARLLKLCGFYC